MAIFSSNHAREVPAPTDVTPNRRRSDGMALSIIAKDMTVSGDLETDGVVKVEGRVHGNIRAGSQVLVSPGAIVQGDVITREAVVAGEVHGTIHASERVELQASAAVMGDVLTPRIAILEGGRLSGAVKMEINSLAEPVTGTPRVDKVHKSVETLTL
ncbi:MAG: polymer-forming cytoskeletal protein [Gemmatimonadales bacterium]|nr:polymer-forming cytoskeletal protein [Gemmatimonadales bacterium]